MLHINTAARIINEAPAPVRKFAAPVSVAWMLGASDGEAGASCTPEQFFLGRESMQNYCQGYLSVNWTAEAVKVAQHYGCEVTK
jgi:hypothetical protein